MRVRIGDPVGVLLDAPSAPKGQKPAYVVGPAVVHYVHGLGTVPCTVDLEIIGEGIMRRDVPYAALSPSAPLNSWHLLSPPDRERVPA